MVTTLLAAMVAVLVVVAVLLVLVLVLLLRLLADAITRRTASHGRTDDIRRRDAMWEVRR